MVLEAYMVLWQLDFLKKIFLFPKMGKIGQALRSLNVQYMKIYLSFFSILSMIEIYINWSMLGKILENFASWDMCQKVIFCMLIHIYWKLIQKYWYGRGHK